MGWTGIYSNEPVADVVRRERTSTAPDSPRTYTIIDQCRKGSVFYVALELREHDKPLEILAEVVRTRTSNRRDEGREVCRMFIEKSGRPVESKCPVCVLAKLSPTESTSAKEWRARCRANARNPRRRVALQIGDAATFWNGPTRTIHEVIPQHKGRRELVGIVVQEPGKPPRFSRVWERDLRKLPSS